MKIHNFSAGPSILPESVIKEASKAVIELDEIGLSLLEISHRSSHFTEIIEEAKELIKELLNISDEYEDLFSDHRRLRSEHADLIDEYNDLVARYNLLLDG